MRLLGFVLVHLYTAFLHGINGEKHCMQDSTNNGINFTRVFIGTHDGLFEGPGADRSLVAANLGSCISPEALVDNMIQFFGSHGFDVNFMRNDPFNSHVRDDYTIDPFSSKGPGWHRVIAGTLYDHANYMNIRMVYTDWAITAKRNLTWGNSIFPTGFWAWYGILRFKVDGNDFCIEYRYKPGPRNNSSTGLSVVEMELHNKDWGTGTYYGVGRMVSNTNYHLKYSMTFPGTKL